MNEEEYDDPLVKKIMAELNATKTEIKHIQSKSVLDARESLFSYVGGVGKYLENVRTKEPAVFKAINAIITSEYDLDTAFDEISSGDPRWTDVEIKKLHKGLQKAMAVGKEIGKSSTADIEKRRALSDERKDKRAGKPGGFTGAEPTFKDGDYEAARNRLKSMSFLIK